MKVVDCHIHYSMNITPDEMINLMDYCDTDIANMVIVPDKKKLSAICDGLMLKDKYPERIYVFASLDAFSYFSKKKTLGKAMVKHTLRMRKAGCDGIKMIEGKPEIRKLFNLPPFDDAVWEEYFAFMENTAFPILWHVNDPEEFWDRKEIPDWAMKRGWYYNDTFVNNQDQYKEIENVLLKYPNLKIIFAHFFFLSKDLDRLANILDKHPNVFVDLTPGIEMYINFTANRKKTLEFFEKYQDRIMYGTDIGTQSILEGGKLNIESEKNRADLVKRFLSAKEEFTVTETTSYLMHDEDFVLKPLDLKNEILKKILGENYLNFMGHKPYKVDTRIALDEIRRSRIKLAFMRVVDRKTQFDFNSFKILKKYFKNQGVKNGEN